ncbi:MAG: VirB8/TrbF family protein [Rickettsiaceae bacterium]|nr:VirB8/TrbF family protein [Rickettsiaceae bacterium]
MEPLYTSLREYIQSGDYYTDAKHWYKHKYIHPFSQRSFVLLLSVIICVLFLGVLVNINGLFPSVIQVKYSITADTSSNKTAQILRANQVNNNPLASVADIIIRNYILQREAYNYDNLKKQFVFVKNNSTRIVFRRFYNFMNIDNPSSPVMLYQKSIQRVPVIISTTYPTPSKAIIKFNSTARNSAGENIENMVWQATIDYEIDKIDPNLPNGTRFNFTVTDYQLKLIEDKRSK